MKNKSLAFITVLLALALALCVWPAQGWAGNDEEALQSISYSTSGLSAPVDGVISGLTITLIVPHSFPSDSVNLSNGLDLSPRLQYTIVNKTFPDGADVTVGNSVRMIVTYKDQTAVDYSSTYTVRVTRAAKINAAFEGAINRQATESVEVSFTNSEFSYKYERNDGAAIAYFTISTFPGSNYPTGRGFTLNNATYTFGSPIQDITQLKFISTTVDSFSYHVYAVDTDGVSIGPVILTINVSLRNGDNITHTTNKYKAIRFVLTNFTQVCDKATSGEMLNYVQFIPPDETSGKLYANYVSDSNSGMPVAQSTKCYRINTSGTPLIGDVFFVPDSDFSGTSVTISYTGYTESNTAYIGNVVITLTGAPDINLSTPKGTTLTFNTADTLAKFDKVCEDTVGGTLEKIVFSIPTIPSVSNVGTLYYDYQNAALPGTIVTDKTTIYRAASTPLINDMAFVPAANFVETVTYNYTGTNTDNLPFEGQIKIAVNATGADVPFWTPKGATVFFSLTDFDKACAAAVTGQVSYIRFTSTPNSSTQGTLRYNYTSSGGGPTVESGVQCNRTDSNLITNVAFVPVSSFSGVVTISYTGANAAGKTFSGQIKITIDKPVTLTVYKNSFVSFSAEDFVSACTSAEKGTLDYVVFSTLSSANGKLYYNYNATSGTGNSISTGTNGAKCYRTGNIAPLLNSVTYVPGSNTGVITIDYTGYSTTNGVTYKGQVIITVESGSTDILFTTINNTPITFDVTAFNNAFSASGIGGTFSYVTFTIPPSSSGALYSNYNYSIKIGTQLTASTKCYRAGGAAPLISDITYVPPSASYTGIVTINFQGYNTGGKYFEGQVKITVNKGGSKYFSDVTSNYNWGVDAIDRLFEKGVVNGTSANQYSPASNIKRGDFILILYRAYSLKATNTNTNFPDVKAGSYYYDAIAVAKALSIARGDTAGRFNPDAPITREDAMVLIARTLVIVGKSFAAGSSIDLASFTDFDMISGYASSDVALLVKAGIIQGSNNKLNPKNPMSRIEMAVVVDRLLNR